MSFAHASWGFAAPFFILVYFLLLHKTIKENIKKWHCLKCCFRSKRDKHIILKNENEDPREIAQFFDPADHLTLYGTTITCPTATHLPRESEVEKEYELLDDIN